MVCNFEEEAGSKEENISQGDLTTCGTSTHDKLKTDGLRVNGCMDGFSHQIIWLKVYRTSSDPKVSAGYYMEAVCAMEGCPNLVREGMVACSNDAGVLVRAE